MAAIIYFLPPSLIPSESTGLTRTSTSSSISGTSTLVGCLDEKDDLLFEICSDCSVPIPSTALYSPLYTLDCNPGSDLDLNAVLDPIKTLLKRETAVLDRPLKIVGLLATSDQGCQQYAAFTARACARNNVDFERRDISKCRGQGDDAAWNEVKQAILEINEDETIDGVIVYFPLFSPEKVSIDQVGTAN